MEYESRLKIIRVVVCAYHVYPTVSHTDSWPDDDKLKSQRVNNLIFPKHFLKCLLNLQLDNTDIFFFEH